MMPNTSVIMPCFNHGRFVGESATAILGQTDGDLELIIVDDNSSDNSWAVIQSLARNDPRVRAIRHERNQGASRSRNDGLRAARGQFIGFCDADDIWEPGKLQFQVDLFRHNPGFDVTYCDASIIDENGAPAGHNFSDRFPPPKPPSGSLFRELLTHNFVNMQSVLMRRECLQQAEGFDEGIKWVEDWLYWVRISREHRFLYSPAPLARYRVHSKSTNVVQKRGAAINRIRVFRRILRQYADLPAAVRADIFRNIGGELCDLGKRRAGRRSLWHAARLSVADFRALATGGRALARLMYNAANKVPRQ